MRVVQTLDGHLDGNGVALHYVEWPGDPDGQSGPPIILIHATGFLAAMWRPIADELAASGHRVIAIDQRGHGDSERSPDGAYRFETFAEDLQRVIQSLGLEGAVAVGHSSGGTTIVMHEAAHPGVISRAVLIEPILPRPEWHASPEAAPGGRTSNTLADGARKRRAVWSSRDEMIESYRGKEMFRRWREDVLRTYVDDGTRERGDGTVELKCAPEVEGAFFDAVRYVEPWRAVERMAMPVLALWGSESHLSNRGLSEQLDAALPDGRTVSVAGTTHFLPQERPDEVARLIAGFVSD
jgi:pimeloyl-ACP methyl ester carboxylesterase